jgi:ATP-dependent Lon protease
MTPMPLEKNNWSCCSNQRRDEDPTKDDIHKIGTVARILRVSKMPDGNVTVILTR